METKFDYNHISKNEKTIAALEKAVLLLDMNYVPTGEIYENNHDSPICDCCEDDHKVMSCEHWRSLNKCCFCINDTVPTALYYCECLYCILLGKVDLEIEWDSYGENVNQVFRAYEIGMEDGYHLKPLIPGLRNFFNLLTLYKAGYMAGLNTRRLHRIVEESVEESVEKNVA